MGPLKAFWIGLSAAVVIAIVAGVVLDSNQISAQQKYSTSNTNL